MSKETAQERQRFVVSMTLRHVAMLDRLAADIRLKHRVALSRASIVDAIVEVAEREGWEVRLFQV